MERRVFLINASGILGLELLTQLLESCSPNAVVPTPTAGFTIDLSSAANNPLNSIGGFILTKGVYVICISSSTYVALSSICTHQGCTVNYSSKNKQFSCPCHGGMFDISGKVIGGPPLSPLHQYKVAVNGTILTIS